jgi:hypothetical protein
MTPNPPRLCPYQPQSSPSLIAPGAVPSGVICSSRCALFVTFSDPAGKPTGGGCSHQLQAITLVNIEQGVRALVIASGAATTTSQVPASDTN